MTAAQTEKLKALALAAIDKGTDGALQEFQGEALPEHVLALIAEVEILRADAERYRWWRVFFDDCDATMPDAVCEAYTAVELDAAIDVAITASKEKA